MLSINRVKFIGVRTVVGLVVSAIVASLAGFVVLGPRLRPQRLEVVHDMGSKSWVVCEVRESYKILYRQDPELGLYKLRAGEPQSELLATSEDETSLSFLAEALSWADKSSFKWYADITDVKARVSDDSHDLLVNVDPYPAKYKTMIRTTSHRDAVIFAHNIDAWWRSSLDDD